MARVHTYKKRIYYGIVFIAFLFMTLISFVSLKVHNGNNDPRSSIVCTVNEGWIAETVEGIQPVTLPAEIKTSGDKVVLKRNMSDMTFVEGLLFENHRQSLLVRNNGEEIFEVNRTPAKRISMVTTKVLIPIPSSGATDDITIEFGDFKDGVCHVNEIYGGALIATRLFLFKSEIVTVCNMAMLTIMGVMLMICTAFFYLKNIKDVRFASVGMFSVITAAWAFADSSLGSLTSASLEYIGLLSYFTSMMMPIPIIDFLWYTCDKKYIELKILNMVCYINICVQCTLAALGVFRFHEMLMVCHGLIGMGIILSLWTLHKELKEDPGSGELKIVTGGIAGLAVMTIAALTLYWLGLSDIYRMIMVTGVSFLFLALGTVLMLSYIRGWQENQARIEQLKAYEKLSFLDNLTGVGNRRAFERDLKKVDEELKEGEDAVLVMLDLNGLKFTNDTYGHSSGDQLIADAAHCIENAYENCGDCYRIGGDEFTVILRNPQKSGQYFSECLDEQIVEYNSKSEMKLSIARGWSSILTYSGKKQSISDWKQEADVNMYIDKASRRPKQEIVRAREFQEIIDCIVMALEARDIYTADHSGRVRELSVYIARRLGLSPETIEQIDMAAHMHDIGKIAVPDNVLLKPGRLTEDEFALMKRHSVIGGQIIARSESMYDISQIVLHHHERFDGRGYPDGISKEDIPIGARIIAIADSIDAMTSKRVYRDSLGIDRCRQEIETNLGRMYDPAIGSIVLENWSDISDIILKHPKDILVQEEIAEEE